MTPEILYATGAIFLFALIYLVQTGKISKRRFFGTIGLAVLFPVFILTLDEFYAPGLWEKLVFENNLRFLMARVAYSLAIIGLGFNILWLTGGGTIFAVVVIFLSANELKSIQKEKEEIKKDREEIKEAGGEVKETAGTEVVPITFSAETLDFDLTARVQEQTYCIKLKPFQVINLKLKCVRWCFSSYDSKLWYKNPYTGEKVDCPSETCDCNSIHFDKKEVDILSIGTGEKDGHLHFAHKGKYSDCY